MEDKQGDKRPTPENPMTHVYDHVANEYDNTFSDNLSLAEDQYIVKLFKPYIDDVLRAGGKILDIGSGTGWLLDHFNIPSYRYEGIDVSDKMVETALLKYPNYSFKVADMREPEPWCFGGATLIASMWTVSNYDAPLPHLLSIARNLRYGGTALLIVHTPAFYKDKRRAAGAALPTYCYDFEGWRPWESADLVEAITEANLNAKIIPFRHYNALPEWMPKWLHYFWLRRNKVAYNDALFVAIVLRKGK